ncbi:uncharacterized protein LOC142241737 [Haematobia irritans]|uniref:uncharacterized protein LOC142241737 n=1 Tax=Haematobia irritans TaxID=7368 RepID=UPI003F5002CF
MYKNFKLTLIFFVLRLMAARTKEPSWTYDLISLKSENSIPDVMTIDLAVKQVSRGTYRAVGTVEILQDLDDDFQVESQLFYSSTGMPNSYVRCAISIQKSTLSVFINEFFSKMVMNQLRNCTNDALYFENTFRPPLTKRIIKFDNCWASNEDLPSHMRSGYYEVLFIFTRQGQAKIFIEVRVRPQE